MPVDQADHGETAPPGARAPGPGEAASAGAHGSPPAEAPRPAPGPGPAPIRVTDLVVRLQGDTILDGVNLAVGPGEMVALLGGNGSGKTTLLRALFRLAPHQLGEIELFGQPQDRFTGWPRLGYVPQKPSITLHATTLAEVVRTGCFAHGHTATGGLSTLLHRRHDTALVKSCLKRVGLEDQAKELFIHLSGGQQQRALLARALAQEPDVLVLDEPLAGVDLEHQQAIHQALAEFKAEGKAVLVVLHETEVLADLVDRAVTLDHGRAVHDGALPEQAPHHHGHELEPPAKPAGPMTGLNPWRER